MKKDEKGMMVVEAVLSFTVFIMVVVAIIYLINIFMLHNRIQFAINSSARELASYSYLYQGLGVRSAELQIKQDGSEYTGNIDTAVTDVISALDKIENVGTAAGEAKEGLSNISLTQEYYNDVTEKMNDLVDSGKDAVEAVKTATGSVKTLVSDPKAMMVGVIYMGAEGATHYVKGAMAAGCASVLTQKYLALENGKSADDYLIGMGVSEGFEGLDFSGSTMFCDPERRLIDIVVEYDIDMSFLELIIPDGKVHVVQRACMPAWLGGDDVTIDSFNS